MILPFCDNKHVWNVSGYVVSNFLSVIINIMPGVLYRMLSRFNIAISYRRQYACNAAENFECREECGTSKGKPGQQPNKIQKQIV
jgi:hypothetical protein